MKYISFLVCLCFFFSGCHRKAPRYVIGVSQCSNDEWRDKMNNEILREALFYEGTEVEIRTVHDDNRQQIEDIRYFIEKGVDLLIVAPNQAAPITPIAEEAFDQQIPVIVVDRKILSEKYTASVSADNYEIGRAVGNYIVSHLKGKGNVVELTGLTGSTPAIDRHQGFMSVISEYPGIRLLAMEDGEWLKQVAEEQTSRLLDRFPAIDLVFAQNDRMAAGAYLAAKERGREKEITFIGIDALAEEGYGVDQILQGTLDATFIYPTGGDRVIQIAMNILQGKAYEKENMLYTAVVDQTNARVMKLQTNHIRELDGKIELLNTQINRYLDRFANQQFFLYAISLILVLLVTLFLLVWKAYQVKIRMNQELSNRNEEITTQKEQLEEQRDQLILLSKELEEATHAKLVFFTNISHDFRTPLTLISDPVDQLLEDKNLSSQQEKLLKLIRKNVNVLLRLVNQILDFRKYENGKLTLQVSRVNMQELLTEWTNAFSSAAYKKHIKFTFEVVPGYDYTVDIDIHKIERVCFNLLSNAFKFTPGNGKIHVQLSGYEEGDENYIRVTVTDTGMGISPEEINKIFERFYMTEHQMTGSGIGLALTKAFVDLHRGTISVESEEGKGSTFTILLPVRQPDYEAAELYPSELNGIRQSLQTEVEQETATFSPEDDLTDLLTEENLSQHSVLVIDDNPDIRNYMKEILQKEFHVIEAVNGREGIKKAMKYIPDLIVCNIMMPVMDGIACCKQLKSELPTSHIPVILLTACSLDEQRIQGFETGADSYISKPFNSNVLEARIRNLIRNRKSLKQVFGDTHSIQAASVSTIDKTFVEKFKLLVEEHLENSELSVEELGEKMGMSRVQLYRKIKSLTNYSPNELIRIARLRKASSLLASTEKTIAEITYEVGFTSPSYFTKCYKEHFGESPTEFLKRKG